MRELRVKRSRHRAVWNRPGVAVPFRVLLDGGVAGCLGYLLPARPRRSLNAWSFRCSCHHPCSRKRLLELSSHGVRFSFTACPEVSANGLAAEGTSLGVSCPYSARGGGSPRLAGLPVELPGCAGISPTGPTQPTTVLLAGFPNLSAACSSRRPPAMFQAGGAPGVPPYRGSFPSRSPGDSSSPAYPLDVAPARMRVSSS